MHTLYGPENTRITFLRAQKLLGPAMVRSISGSKMELDHVDEAMSILDMRSWYTSLQRNASSSDRPEPSRPVQSATSQASTLSYEVLEFERMSLLDFDAYFETLIDNQRDQGVTVDEIRGLRIYEDSAESVDPDSHTAYSIFRMMRAWRGSSTLLNGVTNVHEQTTKQSHEIAAISLAQAAVVLSARSEKESALIAVKRYDDPSSTDEPSRAMENLLDDWHVGQDPTSYIWNSLESRRDMSKEKPFAVQEIPAFRQLPPVVASSQAPSSPARRQQVPPSSQDVMQFASTQPVQGKFGDRKVKRKKKAGF
ncbi:protein of unknown function [Taphrina deformans PYCC 5710]|uniref:RRN6 K-rich C-terminal domain-containing protein n=1 Tax=Taphrina deformans (strain PYCC 5710 / ATCC 11124 / CBS 356.35 / IMI 108563 / JCM 9778 / NBRC 8474) TaxID=1097556 RepID=R4X9Z1_TAPDE|nr:protein of unknown function [Taphrina deformans PYCC 5710]|eukprot:CCG82603.1 protein of unknown function [Taphrina deformans PYCC 5710]